MRQVWQWGWVVASVALASCAGGGEAGGDGGAPDGGVPRADAGAAQDAGMAPDAGLPADGGVAALAVTSSAFVDGGTLPAEFTCDGVGHSPPLAWSGAPAGTAGYALLMTTEAKDGRKWNWVLYGIAPSTTSLAVGSNGTGTAGKTSDGPQLAYAPPCSQGPGEKLYTFTVYALSAAPTFTVPASQVTGPEVTAAVAGITLAKGALTVGYTRP